MTGPTNPPGFEEARKGYSEDNEDQDKKEDASAEGENLLDAYEWFQDEEVQESFVEAALEAVSDTEKGELVRVLGIGSGTALLDAAVDKKLEEAGYNPVTIATDLVTEPSTKARERLAGAFKVENKNMSLQNPEISQGLRDEGEDATLADNSVDLVMARSVTHYEDDLDEEKTVLEEVKRVLKEEGRFVTQAPTPALPAERELFIDIHKTLPKIMNVQTESETRNMLEEVFSGDISTAKSQTEKKLTITSEDFFDRYAPEPGNFDSDSEYQEAIDTFENKVDHIRSIIANVPEEKRPNIWIGEDGSFGWSVPYTTFICENTPTDSDQN